LIQQSHYGLFGSSGAKNLYRYRWLLYELVARDLRLRYRGSALGFAWTLVNPLLFMGVYTLVFGLYLKIGIHNYPVYLLSGLLAWNWFASALQAGTSSILDGRMYVGKTVFPSELLVIVPVLSNLVNYLISLPFLIVVVLLFHQHLGAPLLLLPVMLVIQTVLTVGFLLFFATWNVFFRDLQQLVVYVVMLLFYLIPIFYPATAIPASVRPIVMGNPLAIMIAVYQHMFYYNDFPSASSLISLAIVAVVLLAAGYATFESHKETMGEYL